MRTVLYVTARILPVSSHTTRWGQRTAYAELRDHGLDLRREPIGLAGAGLSAVGEDPDDSTVGAETQRSRPERWGVLHGNTHQTGPG